VFDITYVPMARVFVFGGVMDCEPICAGLAVEQHDGGGLFVDAWERRCGGTAAPLISTPIKARSSPRRCLSTRWNRGVNVSMDGGPLAGQPVYRTAVAECQV